MHREATNANDVLVGRREGKRSLGRPRHRWKDNFREVGWEGVDSLDSSGSE